MTTHLEITCRDPIVSRDGRPFGVGQGNRMRSAGWPLPSVVAGSLRSTIGKAEDREFSVVTAQELLRVEVAGLFPVTGGQLYLPAPQDCVVHPDQGPLRTAPHPLEGGGCDLPPGAGLLPVGLTGAQAPIDFKPLDAPAWWPLERYAAWLAGEDLAFDDRFLKAPEIEHRTHAQLDAAAGAADDGKLFTTAALCLTHLPRHGIQDGSTHAARFAAIKLAGRVRGSDWCANTAAKLDTMHPLGGERRVVHWKAAGDPAAWGCPQRVREALSSTTRVRMALATPAVFRDGWKPEWLKEDLVGEPPGSHVRLRLVGVSIQRWRAVSGWSLANLKGQPRGPKPVKRVVPAGGVYFFEVVDGKAADLADRWLEPISDHDQDRLDGFGLAAWGIW